MSLLHRTAILGAAILLLALTACDSGPAATATPVAPPPATATGVPAGPTAAPTATAIPPSPTSTGIPASATPVPTATPGPPSATPGPTETPRRSPTPRPTATPVPPTRTPRPAPTHTPVPPARPTRTPPPKPPTGATAVPAAPATATTAPATAGPLATATTAPAGARHYVFPVQPVAAVLHYEAYHHDYPATDIFCPIGSRFVAVTDGVVDYVSAVDRWDPAVNDGATRGGLSVAIIGDDGVRYYGSHLSAVAAGIVPGVRVSAGQLLGRTGKTGDARYVDPHLHFGISRPTRPDDWATRRGQVLPYPYLRAWAAGQDVTPRLGP